MNELSNLRLVQDLIGLAGVFLLCVFGSMFAVAIIKLWLRMGEVTRTHVPHRRQELQYPVIDTHW